MINTTPNRRQTHWGRLIAGALLVTLAWTQSATAAPVTTLATTPLANSTSSAVRPNIMYVLDDSGSMAWDYTPDYINDTGTGAMCWDTNSGVPRDSDSATQCSFGRMPWMTSDVNYQYYSPDIRYMPPVNANGTSYPASTASNAKLDGYGIASTSTTNLTNSYTHTSWCNSSSRTPTAADPTAGGNCRENKDTTSSSNLYPNYGYAYPRTFSGAPYYYTMAPSEYCSDSGLTSCIRSTAPATIGGVDYTYPSLYRWCSSFSGSSNTFGGCQGRWSQGTLRPNYLGGYTGSATSGSKATAAITVGAPSSGQSITAVTVNGVNIMQAGTISSPANGTTATQIAQALCTSIHANRVSSGYGCPNSPSGATLTIEATTVGTTPNGYPVVVVGPAAVSAINSVGSVSVTSAPVGAAISQIRINANNLLTSPVNATGAIDTTAQAICNAIKVGPSSAVYQVRTGSATWGTCSAGGTGIVEIRRISADTADNGQPIIVTGGSPATGANASATLTVNTTLGATQVSNITLGGISILTGSLPMIFADGNAVGPIATAIAGRISSSYTTSVSGGTITITRATKDTTDNGKVLAATNTGAAATATITVGGAASGSNAGTLGTIAVSGTQIVRALTINDLPTVLSANSATNAQTITDLVTNGYIASRSGSVITVTAPVGNADNGHAFTITAGSSGTQAGAATRPVWLFNITSASERDKQIKEIRCGDSSGNRVMVDDSATTGWSYTSSTWVPSLASTIQGTNGYSISCTSSTPSVCTVTGPSTGPTSCSNKRLYIDASDKITCGQASGGGTFNRSGDPCNGTINIATDGAAAGPNINYVDFKPYLSSTTFAGGRAAQSITGSTMNGGVAPTIGTTTSAMTAGAVGAGAIPTNATGIAPNIVAMSGGAAGMAANSRANAGIFKRTDIVPTATVHTAVTGASVTVGSTPTYPKGGERTDCAATSSCTYTEELQNFANWYTYYRTRMQMMKTTSTLSFIGLDGRFRVGFDTISDCASGCNSTVRLPVAQFVDTGGERASQKSNWWAQLVATTTPSATPLRAETAKIGRYYAGKLTISGTHPDPMQYSCQQNFTLLVTDGYWNEAERSDIRKVDGTDIGNTDNDLATAPRPFYDGQMASTSCPSVGTGTRSGYSSCRTLADITWYYATTDIRSTAFGNATNVASGQDVAANKKNDPKLGQHMYFYALGLGIDGTLVYRSDYDTAGVGDYAEIVAGTRQWPAVANLDPTGIDDLWHAAVNGRGKYFSARNPTTVAAGLKEALNNIEATAGAASAAATSTLKPVAGDNFAYVSSYKTVEWTGDLQARTINLQTGAVSADTDCGAPGSGCPWSAQALLDARNFTTRKIYIAPTSNASGALPRSFTYADLSGATEQGYFNPNTLTQWGALSASNPTSITPAKLVDYLRGDRGLEQNGTPNQAQIWRKRTHVLGDIVDSKLLYVKGPVYSYTDAGYAHFKVGPAATRIPMVYVGANDGMLHAFDAATGREEWAFIPNQAMASMKLLADSSYTHRNFVNGPMTVGDVNFGGGDSDWHTVLIAGMGGGGTQYFALDITDPLNPKYLWQFTHAGLGNTFGNISINKLPNGQWAAFFSSGYNNADGIGRLYAVDVKTGALKSGYPLSTASGTGVSPSNLSQINVWVDRPRFDNTAKFIYAGDLNGDLWRFDPDPSASGHSGASVFKLARLQNASGQAQPITTKPEMTRIDDKTVIYVGTGQYLGIPDLTNTQVQSFYAIKDTLGAKNLAPAGQTTWNPRSDTGTVGGVAGTKLFQVRKLIGTMSNGLPVTRTVGGVTVASRMICPGADAFVNSTGMACANGTIAVPTNPPPPMDWSIYGGWFVDLPDSGERMNVDMTLVSGTLMFATNVPASTVCSPGGYGFLNYLDYRTGLPVGKPDDPVSVKFDTLIVGLASFQIGAKIFGSVGGADGSQNPTEVPVAPSGFSNKRALWREFEVY